MDIGDKSISKDEFDDPNNPLAKPAYDEIERQMQELGWVDAEGIPTVDDLYFNKCSWRNPEDNHYYIGVMVYRESNPPKDDKS
ncbi:MAG: hypothetical protein ABIG30_03000 [Candidatus Aenigmatarchaeota archaeon]